MTDFPLSSEPARAAGPSSAIAPGSVVVVRDEEWLVTSMEATADGNLLQVQGLSDLVRGTTAMFYDSLDDVAVLDPAAATVRADDSPRYRKARLWVESTLRKSAVPVGDDRLSVSSGALASPLTYQHSAVKKALDPDNLRPRILLADAVGLGKTLEIGMILSELIRRGRGERILIVCPRHVLEQTQHEMWSRFAIPFVRLDSVGIQQVKQKLPATRNPFTYFKRVIISIDTLKQDHLVTHLKRHRWDAVVIDESHNVTNSATQNNRLARTVAPNTDALILASATPHNGKPESFAELVRLLEPTAVTPTGEVIPEELNRLVIRRHRHSDEVKAEVGSDWQERREPNNMIVPASAAEDAVADELDRTWLNPPGGTTPYSGKNSRLFPWTLAKAFLSSPNALDASIKSRLDRLGTGPEATAEKQALLRLDELNQATITNSAKYDALVSYLKQIGVARGSDMRAVVFAERVPTLEWLRAKLMRDFGFKDAQVAILHGGLTDVDQQAIVESFKQQTSPIRVLVTGDVASEGVNLHRQCHQLIHYDIPWSLIRIEQRNGRIDRYGQKTPPQITTLLLTPSNESFAGDLRVLTKLMEKEQQAHQALGDAASLMGKYSVEAEEEQIRKVLAGQADFDEVVANPDDQDSLDPMAQLLAMINTPTADVPTVEQADQSPLYGSTADFLAEAMTEIFTQPELPPARNGVNWRRSPKEHYLEFVPPADLRQRLDVLPQSYLSERNVLDTLKLVTNPERGKKLLDAALSDTSDSSWPEAHYLGPLHPVLDWAADRALASLPRNEVFAVRTDVEDPTVLLQGTITNKRGHVIAATWYAAKFPMFEADEQHTGPAILADFTDASTMLREVGFHQHSSNPGAVDVSNLSQLIPRAVSAASGAMANLNEAISTDLQQRIDRWSSRVTDWQSSAEATTTRLPMRERRISVAEEERLIESMAPDRQFVRPLLVVVPHSFASAYVPGGVEHDEQAGPRRGMEGE